MRRRKMPVRTPHRDRWLVSYADFITLLFAFFVVMYSAAQLDKRRAGQLAAAIQTAFLQRGSSSTVSTDAGGLPARLDTEPEQDQSALRSQIENTFSAKI